LRGSTHSPVTASGPPDCADKSRQPYAEHNQ
jgi:hypothetical protein